MKILIVKNISEQAEETETIELIELNSGEHKDTSKSDKFFNHVVIDIKDKTEKAQLRN